MNESEAKKQIANLRKRIREHDRKYYVLAEPEISDYEYDQLLRQLESLESSFPDLITSDSPTRRVGSDLTKTFDKVRHSQPMLSIANTYSEEELLEFDRRIHDLLPGEAVEYVAELKIDGVAISLRFENGVLARAVTRGDGIVGDDVTANARTIRSVPLKVDHSGPFEVRGEVFMDRPTLAELNAELDEESRLHNPRNATAGTLKQQNPRIVAKRKLRFWAHFVLGEGFHQSHWENLNTLKRLGFPVQEHMRKCGCIEQVLQFCSHWDRKRGQLDFETDGVVVKVDRIELHTKLGATAKSPRWVAAFKYKPESASTRVLGIEAQVGRTGAVTPVARLTPVELSGTTVSNATLHNYEEVKRLDVRIGDRVHVEKGGEIIPKITGVDLAERPSEAVPFAAPEKCPECNSPLEKSGKEVALRCENISCPAQTKRAIQHFVCRTAMNVEDIGSALIDQLLESGQIQTWADLYSLKHHQLMTLERMGDKSAQNVLDALEKSKNNSLDRLIHALGIRHIGAGAARTLAGHITYLRDLEKKTGEELLDIHEIGPAMAESVKAWFSDPGNQTKLDKLERAGVRFDNKEGIPSPNADSPISGKVFVVTGTLEKHSRQSIEELIRSNGAKASSSVSKRTDYLVAGKDAGSKLAKAQKLGIPVLTEGDFLVLISES